MVSGYPTEFRLFDPRSAPYLGSDLIFFPEKFFDAIQQWISVLRPWSLPPFAWEFRLHFWERSGLGQNAVAGRAVRLHGWSRFRLARVFQAAMVMV